MTLMSGNRFAVRFILLSELLIGAVTFLAVCVNFAFGVTDGLRRVADSAVSAKCFSVVSR